MESLNKYKELYDNIDFKDREVVKTLLYYKPYFDKSDFISSGSSYNRIEPNQNMYLDLIDVYTDLDELVTSCDLSEKNKRLLRLVNSGYTISYIYTNFENYSKEATVKMFNRIAEKINEKQKEKEGRENDYSTSERRRKEVR